LHISIEFEAGEHFDNPAGHAKGGATVGILFAGSVFKRLSNDQLDGFFEAAVEIPDRLELLRLRVVPEDAGRVAQ
jgi:hypothetical protein